MGSFWGNRPGPKRFEGLGQKFPQRFENGRGRLSEIGKARLHGQDLIHKPPKDDSIVCRGNGGWCGDCRDAVLRHYFKSFRLGRHLVKDLWPHSDDSEKSF